MVRMGLNGRPGPLHIANLPILLFGVLLLLMIAFVGVLSTVALRQVDALSSTYSDNFQFSIAQIDVDTLRFKSGLDAARLDPSSDLTDLRLDFDILYSRLNVLERRNINRDGPIPPELMRDLANLRAAVDRMVPVIDGPDAGLRAALPDLSARLDDMIDTGRKISTQGSQVISASADAQRGMLRQLLVQMAVTVLALMAASSVLAVVLMRLWQISRARATAVSRVERQLRTIVDTSFDAIFVCDRNGLVRDYNSTAHRTFGGRADSLAGAPIVDVIAPRDRSDDPLNDAFSFFGPDNRRKPGRTPRTLFVRRNDDSNVPAELSVDSVNTDAGLLYVIFVRDISARYHAEAQLTDARDRALAGERAKAEFLAMMSHEMRTPLNGLLGTIALLRDTALTSRQTGLLSTMRGAGQHLLDLVNDILLSAEVDSAEIRLARTDIDVPDTVNEVVGNLRGLAAAKNIALNWSFDGIPVTRMTGDPQRVRQILLNLVGNAIKFTESGRIDIEIARPDTADGLIEFRVRDTGTGIAKEHMDRIFTDFSRLDGSYARRTGGSGLGLGIARRLARLMGGDVGVDPSYDQGSLFWLRLPLIKGAGAVPDASGADRDRQSACAPRHLLIVEDNAVNAMVLHEFLIADGHTTVIANSGEAALELARHTRFDAILMDISMPGMDGMATTRTLRAGPGPCHGVPVIAVTAHALPSELREFHEAGMVASVSKPVDRDALRAVIAKVTAGTTGPDPLPLIEPRRLSELAELGGPDTLQTLSARFDTEADAAVTRLISPDLTTQEMEEISHSIASSAAAMGLPRFSARLATLERDASAARDDERPRTDGLRKLWQDSRSALLAAVNGRTAA